MITQQPMTISPIILESWWLTTVRENRLFIRLISEDVQHLAQLSYLQIIGEKINESRIDMIEADYPHYVEDIRLHLLSAQRYFIECLQALMIKDPIEAQMLHNLAHAEISMLQYIFMTHGIKSYIR